MKGTNWGECETKASYTRLGSDISYPADELYRELHYRSYVIDFLRFHLYSIPFKINFPLCHSHPHHRWLRAWSSVLLARETLTLPDLANARTAQWLPECSC